MRWKLFRKHDRQAPTPVNQLVSTAERVRSGAGVAEQREMQQQEGAPAQSNQHPGSRDEESTTSPHSSDSEDTAPRLVKGGGEGNTATNSCDSEYAPHQGATQAIDEHALALASEVPGSQQAAGVKSMTAIDLTSMETINDASNVMTEESVKENKVSKRQVGIAATMASDTKTRTKKKILHQSKNGSAPMSKVIDVTDLVVSPGGSAVALADLESHEEVPPWGTPPPLPTHNPGPDVNPSADTNELVKSIPVVDDSTPLAAEVAEDARRRLSLMGQTFPRPPYTRVLTVANQKGGVGKTTTTVNVAAALAQSGMTVLVLDIDPQGNASTALGIEHHSEVPSLYDVIIDEKPLADVIQVCPDIPSLLCAPATIDLAGAEIELVSVVAREVRLKNALQAYLSARQQRGEAPIDYVFIDCPPSLSLLTVNAFVAASEVFIPIQCEYYALEGLTQLLKHIDLIKGHLNPHLHISTILLTMYDGRTKLASQVVDEVRQHFPQQVVNTTVPRSVRISEAPSHGQTVMTYDPGSSGALSYLEAARELAEQVLSWPTVSTSGAHHE